MSDSTSHTSRDIKRYYASLGSRLGYGLLLRNVRHCGYYEEGDYCWQIRKAQRKMEQKLGLLLNLPKNSTVLDAGCGTGSVALTLARDFQYKVKGIDLLKNSINRAEKAAKKSDLQDLVEFEVGDYGRLSYDINFDGIYTMETLAHSADPKAVLENFYQTLKPGGRLVMHEYFHAPLSKMPQEVAAILTDINEAAGMPGVQIFDRGYLGKIAKEAGFERIETLDMSQNVKPLWKIFYLLAYVPFKVVKLLRLKPRMPNLMAAGVVYENQLCFGYCVVSAHKPKQ